MSDNQRQRELTRMRVKNHRERARCSTPVHEEKSQNSSTSIENLEACFVNIDQVDVFDDNAENSQENLSDSSNLTQNSSDYPCDGNSVNDSCGDESSQLLDNDDIMDDDGEGDLMEASMDEDEFYDCEAFVEFDEYAELRAWALSGNPTIPHTRLDALLKILRVRLLPNLPKSSKTFLKTGQARYDIYVNEDLSEFVYLGLKKSLEICVNPALHSDNIVHLKVNVDGVQLFKSSSKQFWPILCQVHSDENVYQPFPAAIYSGQHKPYDLTQFLEQFIEEVNILQEHGLDVNGQHLEVNLMAFICDRPARALIKCIKNHGGYDSCERCTVHGERDQNRTVYPVPEGGCEKRTDTSFRNQANPEHHQGTTPLLNIRPKMNMISTFVLDFMHLVCLGIMKKILMYWLKGHPKIKLNQTAKSILTNLLFKIQHQVPQEFHRTTRSFVDMDKFKASELKFLLLYCGLIIFKKVLPRSYYEHFLLLHTACRILCSKKWAVAKWKHAKKFLTSFVSLSEILYSKFSIIGNMHSLLHMADDVWYMKCSLSSLTAFPFENTLGIIKKFLRSGNRPLAQIVRRLHESCCLNLQRAQVPPQLEIIRQLNPNKEGQILIKKLRYKGAVLTARVPDNTVLLNNDLLVEIRQIFIPPGGVQSDIKITAAVLKKVKPMFIDPCNSGDLDMWAVSRRNSITRTFLLNKVNFKMVTLDISSETEEEIYTMPLLHM